MEKEANIFGLACMHDMSTLWCKLTCTIVCIIVWEPVGFESEELWNYCMNVDNFCLQKRFWVSHSTLLTFKLTKSTWLSWHWIEKGKKMYLHYSLQSWIRTLLCSLLVLNQLWDFRKSTHRRLNSLTTACHNTNIKLGLVSFLINCCDLVGNDW